MPLRSESQSLFNIYYLGNTVVDRRCSSAVMPWIIEEMKIKAAKMRFLWLTPGEDVRPTTQCVGVIYYLWCGVCKMGSAENEIVTYGCD